MPDVALSLPVHRRLTGVLHDNLFQQIHRQSLIYNTCVEDPHIDRQLMQLNSTSRVVVITSGGCNALDYLLDGPEAVYAVDMNPRQNALLWLKKALLQQGHFGDLFAFFGQGHHPAYREVYRALRRELPEFAAAFWDTKIHFFDGTRGKRSFYYQSTTGSVAWWLKQYLLHIHRRIGHLLFDLIEAETLDEQQAIYHQIEPHLWHGFARWVMDHPFVMALLGVPRAQIRLIQVTSPQGISHYVRERLHKVCTTIPMRDNYFWRVYMTGSYTLSCCPNYLKRENQPILQETLARLHIYTGALSDFLRQHTGAISHFVLLDHQDWLAWHDPHALEQEWSLILQRAEPGSKILWRSASEDATFLPEWVRGRIRFHPELTTPLHEQDRLGMYHSLHLAEVQ